MAGIMFNSAHTSVSATTSAGKVTVGSSTGFAVGAKVWLAAAPVYLLNYTGRGATAFSGTITGGSSGATATVVSDSLPALSTGSGVLTISGISGVFQAGETLTGSTGSGNVSGYLYSTSSALYCQITSIPDTTHVTLRVLPNPGQVLADKAGGGGGAGDLTGQYGGQTGNNVAYPNYGNSDVSSISSGTLDQESQLIYVTNADNSLNTHNPPQ